MNRYAASIYEMREDEIAAERNIRRERIARAVEAVVCVPVVVGAVVALILF